MFSTAVGNIYTRLQSDLEIMIKEYPFQRDKEGFLLFFVFPVSGIFKMNLARNISAR